MIVLTLKTDQELAVLAVYDQTELKVSIEWQAGRQLAETLHQQIKAIMATQDLTIADIGGVIVFEGPGSFTGLRIGITTANTLAYALNIPIVGSTGTDWKEQGLNRLTKGDNDNLVMPVYGAPVNITLPKK
jgi:tRNA threonylcarbamoyladenosine biosynthesis protein TsaB